MTIQRSYPLPESPSSLNIPSSIPTLNSNTTSAPTSSVQQDKKEILYLCFLASPDPATGEAWCPDVRAALPLLERVFGGGSEEGTDENANGEVVAGYIEVGSKEEWRVQTNIYRTIWKITALPTVVRYERVHGTTTTEGEVKETGRLVENEVLEKGRLEEFVKR